MRQYAAGMRQGATNIFAGGEGGGFSMRFYALIKVAFKDKFYCTVNICVKSVRIEVAENLMYLQLSKRNYEYQKMEGRLQAHNES